ncbi:CARDB domain-containing protein [Natrinema halophilum]|uniref:CARDB domain-containing protein n=1 Tax=Natrinema halophilum TaxID=1699371 RepID=A0A7D5KDC5_9EURY|nr:CARDB domain-containing protein [Natrinema halophilum]QLG49316.1 hypothetical protein HYG82_10805 [Natrinema halophilum]
MSVRYTFLVLLTVVGATVSTGAVVIAANGGPQSDTTDRLELEPASGPNGDYARISGDQLELDLERLNEDAVTHADDVFTITVTDDVERVWIDHDVSGLTFYKGGDPTHTISESSPLEPATGKTKHIGVAVDTSIAQNGTETFTVMVEYEDDEPERDDSDTGPVISGYNLTVSPMSLETGETVTATATYRNVGDETGSVTASLTVDGTVVEQRSIELGPGESTSVTFERTMYWPESFDVGIEGVGSRSVTVKGPPIDVVNASVDDASLTAGESTTIRATVSNPTDAPVERTLEFAVDGIVVDSRVVSIPANGERTLTFERTFGETGTYEIAVSGITAGTVRVDEPGPLAIRNRELSAVTTAALAPPASAGLMILIVAANRRWTIV